jgi:NAD(P)-dependent dehydrogenase (short-subunit alcohol dehydrogenase family)
MPTALITGITGQDGSYLAELLLSKGYRVIGVARRSSTVTSERIEHLLDQMIVVQGDLHDQGSLLSLLEEYQPTEVYNLAAQSFVPTSWNQPALTGDITAIDWRYAHAGSDPLCKLEDPFLSGVFQRDVWQGVRSSSERRYAVLSAQSVWCCESVWALDHGQLS